MNSNQTRLLAEAKVNGVTNSFMAYVPEGDFFEHIIYELPLYTHGKFELFRHTTIIFSTGLNSLHTVGETSRTLRN